MIKQISLAYALKLKARLTKKVNIAIGKFKEIRNVYAEDNTQESDKLKALFDYQAVKKKYLAVVSIITKANAENNIPMIVQKLDGLKTEYNLINTLEEDDSPLRDRNPSTGEWEYTKRKIQITKAMKESMLAEIEKCINDLQDELDNINGSFIVEIDENLLS